MKLGVLQGGVISPIFFICYIDVIYYTLKESGYGCYVTHLFMGLIGFADDHVILSPTKTGLYILLNVINAVAHDLNIKFNPSKSKFIHFTKNRNCDSTFTYENKSFDFNKEVVYLGVKITYNLKDDNLITSVRHNIMYNASGISQLLSNAHHSTTMTVMKSKCLHLYGLETIFLRNDNTTHKIQTAWNRSVRNALHLPYRTHVNIVGYLSNFPYLKHFIYQRFIKFIGTFTCTNSVTRVFYNKFLNDTNSYLGNNFWTSKFLLSCYTPNLSPYSTVISDLLECRFGLSNIPGFTRSDINCMLNFICTN